MNTAQDELTYQQLFSFFLPLAIMPIVIGISHNAINAALARMASPEISLAAFTIVKSVSNIIKAPNHMSRQIMTSLVNDKQSYLLVSKFVIGLSLVFFLILFCLGFTPLGEWVLKNIIGLVEQDLISFAVLGFRVACFLPFVEVLRNMHHGIAVGLERTNFITPGALLRLIFVVIFLFWMVQSHILPGIVAGNLSWLLGIGLEAAFIVGVIIYYYGSLSQAAEHMVLTETSSLKLKDILTFFSPIALMAVLTKLVQPIIQSGIARIQSDPELLAAYGVGWTVVIFLANPLKMLHQCSLVYQTEDNESAWQKIRNFGLGFGLIVTSLLLILGSTVLGKVVLMDLIGVSSDVAQIGQQLLLAFSLFPLIRSFREIYWGALMRKQDTSIIGTAKAINVVVVAGGFLILQLSLTVNAAVIGALSFTLGQLVESVVIWYYHL